MTSPKEPSVVSKSTQLSSVGWREWAWLPELFDLPIKAKVDTGAKTSALHAFYIEPYMEKGQSFVKFFLHPYQNDSKFKVECHAPVVDQREVTDSGGHKEKRYVIETEVVTGNDSITSEFTLTDRDSMMFRMLLGRNALTGRYLVDSGSSFLQGGSSKKAPGT